jgi:hypothetical protein
LSTPKLFHQAKVSALFETLLLFAVVHQRRLGLERTLEYAAISSAAGATSQTVSTAIQSCLQSLTLLISTSNTAHPLAGPSCSTTRPRTPGGDVKQEQAMQVDEIPRVERLRAVSPL